MRYFSLHLAFVCLFYYYFGVWTSLYFYFEMVLFVTTVTFVQTYISLQSFSLSSGSFSEFFVSLHLH